MNQSLCNSRGKDPVEVASILLALYWNISEMWFIKTLLASTSVHSADVWRCVEVSPPIINMEDTSPVVIKAEVLQVDGQLAGLVVSLCTHVANNHIIK